MSLNWGVGDDSWESLGLQGDPTSQSWRKSVLNIHGRTDVEAEAPILWPPEAKNWLIWKDPNVGKDWRREDKGMTGDEMVGWHHRLSGYDFGQTPGVGNGQGSLLCCSPWGCKELGTTEWLNWTELNLEPLEHWLFWAIRALMYSSASFWYWWTMSACNLKL